MQCGETAHIRGIHVGAALHQQLDRLEACACVLYLPRVSMPLVPTPAAAISGVTSELLVRSGKA